MVARDVEHAASSLRVLRHEARDRLGLAIFALALAIGASQLRPDFAVPFLIGGVAVLFLSLRTMLRRWELIDQLLPDRDAYMIEEVRRRAEQAASMQNRHVLATSIQWLLTHPGSGTGPRIAVATRELEMLAAELENESLAFDPACAVACERLVNNTTESPLRNPALPPDEVRSRLTQILGGFAERTA